MLPALALSVLVALHLTGLLLCCLPGEFLHRYALPVYQYTQLHWPAWLPHKWSYCVFCGSFWLAGVPVAAASALYLEWWCLAVPMSVAVLTTFFTLPFLKA